jgi:hypothetical protein
MTPGIVGCDPGTLDISSKVRVVVYNGPRHRPSPRFPATPDTG